MSEIMKKPRIRFKGFTEAWEQRKLGELVERVIRKNTNNESTLPLTISAQYGLVDQITYFNNRVASRDVSNYFLVLNGEFAYNKSTSDGYPFGAVKRLDLYEKGVLSTLYIVFAPKSTQKINSDFLTVFLIRTGGIKALQNEPLREPEIMVYSIFLLKIFLKYLFQYQETLPNNQRLEHISSSSTTSSPFISVSMISC